VENWSRPEPFSRSGATDFSQYMPFYILGVPFRKAY